MRAFFAHPATTVLLIAVWFLLCWQIGFNAGADATLCVVAQTVGDKDEAEESRACIAAERMASSPIGLLRRSLPESMK